MTESVLENVPQDEWVALFGSRDEHLRALRDALGIKIVARQGTVTLQGTPEQVEAGRRVLDRLREHYRLGKDVSAEDVRYFLSAVKSEPDAKLETSPIEIAGPLRRLRARSSGQGRYVEAMRKSELCFCIGPAGTGKTYLAVAAALEFMFARQIKRIVLVRPAVEAGEKLGYLPGDLQAKVHPFLRPLLDALRDMLDFHQVRTYLDNDVIEIAPLAYMRGRTLNESFIILDEGQNTTIAQMKMFLTRMGYGSRIVVTGDLTQVDLPSGTRNGLQDAVHRLGELANVSVIRMEKQDIVRHPLVQLIVHAYEADDTSPGPTP